MANSTEDGMLLIYNEVFKKIMPDYMIVWAESLEYKPWLFAFFGSALVGLSGIFPLLVIPIDDKSSLTSNGKSYLYYQIKYIYFALNIFRLESACHNKGQ